MGRKIRHSYIWVVLFFLQQLCPCFSDYVSEDQLSDNSYEPLYSAQDATGKSEDEFTLWQFKKLSNDGNDEHRYPPPHPLPQTISHGWPGPTSNPRPRATERTQTKQSKFRLPNFSAIFSKHKFKGRGRGKRPGGSRQPQQQAYAPSFISYGPIFGPPPMQQQQNQWQPQKQQQNQWQQQQQNQQQNQWQQPQQQNMWQQPQSHQPQNMWKQQQQQQNMWKQQQQKRPSYSQPAGTSTESSEYGAPPQPPVTQNYATPANRPHYGGGGFPAPTQMTPATAYGAPLSTTRTFTHPPPTYGPTVRINYRPPNQDWSSATTRTPSQNQNQGPWNPIPPRRPAQNRWTSPATSRAPPQVQNNYIAPTYVPPTGGYATPSSSYIPPNPNNNRNNGQNQGNYNYAPTSPAPQYGTRSYEPPMHFGQPMHNFGPPKSSYGQPPPIIGDPPHDRYAPKEDIYRYPTGNDNSGNSNSYHSPGQRYDNSGAETSQENVDEKPSTNLYQTPSKPYREPKQRKTRPKPQPVEDDYDDNDYSKTKSYSPAYEDSSSSVGQYAANARPPPKYDTNYNSPGLSKDLNIVDWMPYSAKNYHEVPGKKKKKPKYRTLPERLQDHRPDPEHEKYPKLTYDTLSKRMSAAASEEAGTPLLKLKRRSEAEIKTEKEFNEMVQVHAKLVAIR